MLDHTSLGDRLRKVQGEPEPVRRPSRTLEVGDDKTPDLLDLPTPDKSFGSVPSQIELGLATIF
jgi:hypothetical protein